MAVLGPNADDPQANLGDWAGASGQVDWMPDGHPRETVETVLDGFRAVVPPTWTVTHARGAEIETLVPDPEGPLFPDGQPRPPVSAPAPVDPDQLAEAVAAARAADLAVVVLGDTIALTGEGCSTATLDLQGGQVALLDALVDALDGTGTPVVVVLLHSKPNVLPPSALRRRRGHRGLQPRHARRPRRRRARPRPHRADPAACPSRSRGTSASSRPTTTRSAASTATATPTSPRSRSSSSARA